MAVSINPWNEAEAKRLVAKIIAAGWDPARQKTQIAAATEFDAAYLERDMAMLRAAASAYLQPGPPPAPPGPPLEQTVHWRHFAQKEDCTQ